MTDMQHYCVMTSLLRPFDAANDAVVTPTFSEVVLASDAEAAIAAARADERVSAELHDYHMPAWTAGYRQAIADGIAAVETERDSYKADCINEGTRPDNRLLAVFKLSLAALRALNPD